MSEGVRQRVNGPAIGLIVTGGLGVLIVIFSLVSLLLDPQQQSQHWRERFPEVSTGLYYAGNAILLLLWLGASAFLIVAGMRMRQLKDWVLCVVACFVSLVPCLACCCVVGIPVGIWGLVVLMKDDVKQAFTS
jgi:uncharacterized membrane protein YbhN (UPF0104 family)